MNNDPTLAPRILALPADVRATLAAVPGPGWAIYEYQIHHVRTSPYCIRLWHTPVEYSDPFGRQAWWPANPAAAVCAVCDVLPHAAHKLLAEACLGLDDDHSASLSVIERHIAYFSGQSSIPDDINGSEP